MPTLAPRLHPLLAALCTLALGACSPSHQGQCLDLPEDHHALAAEAGPKRLLNLDDQGLAIQGYDPVAYFSLPPRAAPVKGDPRFQSVHEGAVYWFASAENKSKFDADPARYAPQFGGWCAYAASIDKLSPIGPEWWEIVDGRLLLQHNQKAWDLWHADPAASLVKADRNWPGLVEKHGTPEKVLVNVDKDGLALGGYDAVSYFQISPTGKPALGSPQYTSRHLGALYRFASAENKARFDADPDRYAPQFGGFCGYAASINKVSPVDPTIWQLVDGRLVLQHTPEAYRLFNQDAQANYAKARQNWPRLTARTCRS
jgi:YHS domain-containing protein